MMVRFGLGEALFSLKCFAAAMLAYYIALRIGLTHPFWAVTTSYIVAQPLAGAVLSKAVFRVCGTILGASAAVVLVPNLVNEPLVLSLALALWLGLCLYIALLDRTPRAYVFLLAGYTASIVGFPSVLAPDTIFDTAVLRVQEIILGIACATLVHGLVFPQTVTARLLSRIDEILADAERWSRDALALDEDNPQLDRDRRRLALDIAELDVMSIQLPFDTARLLPRVRTVRALQDQLSLMLPLASAVDDRIAELARSGEAPRPAAIQLLEDVRHWLGNPTPASERAVTSAALMERAHALEPPITEPLLWRDALRLSLLARLAELIAAHRNSRDLRDQIRAPTRRLVTPTLGVLLNNASRRAIHRDRGLALRAAAGTAATIMLGCIFWIATGWPDGAGAVLIAGVCCALFGNVDAPGPVILTFFFGSVIGLVLAALYAFAILPRVTDFVTLAAVLAPLLLFAGAMLARPATTLLTLGSLLGFLNAVGLNDRYDSSFDSFLNGAVAQLAGTFFAVVTVGLFQTIGTETSAGRLVRAGWRELALRCTGPRQDRTTWVNRMLDRIGLLVPRLANRAADAGKPLSDALVDLRIGVSVGDLRELPLDAHDTAQVGQVLQGVGRHFARLDPAAPVPPPGTLLACIDRALTALAASPIEAVSRGGVLALTSLRRNLFPAAQPFTGVPA